MDIKQYKREGKETEKDRGEEREEEDSIWRWVSRDKDKVRVSWIKRLKKSLMLESAILPNIVIILNIIILFCKALTGKCFYLVCTNSHT